MPQLSELLSRLPNIKEVRMSALGHLLWISWQTDLDPAVPQTLQNYGGMFILSDRNQSLWFFFTTDVFLALARLSVWARFNELHVCIEQLPAKLLLGVKREVGLDIETALTVQEIIASAGLELWIHPKALIKDLNIPGITFERANAKQGMASAHWATINADVRLPYTSSQGWYAILRPLGNPLDKNFQAGWPHMYAELEKVLQQHKFKFMLHDNFIMVTVDNLRMLRTWLRDMLSICATIKTDQHDLYWPCVSVIIDRKGLNFSSDLYKKVGLQWDNLMPDFPYMSYRNGYLLGEGFSIHDIRFSNTQTSMDSWSTVALDEGSLSVRAVPLLMSGQLTSGHPHGCYFCGIRSHEAHECPTRAIPASSSDIWWEMAGLSLDNLNDSFREIERAISEKGIDAYADMLSGSSPTALLLHAIFEINGGCQLRFVPRIWLTKNREITGTSEEGNLTRDDSPVWDLHERLMKASSGDLPALEKDIQFAAARNPRDARLRTLHGFLSLAKGDVARAEVSFKEGAALTTAPQLQAWNEFLLARLAESQGHYAEALNQYEQILRVAPQWKDLEYRQIVCKVKMGFAEQVLGHISKLIKDDPAYFNRCLVDPELGRGQLLILTSLQPLWEEAEREAEAEKAQTQRLSELLDTWFTKEHPAYRQLSRDLHELQRLAEIKNYVAFLQVAKRRPVLEKDINDNVQGQIEELQDRFKHYLAGLQEIRDEASWFPFPKILREFSRAFNECAGIINWAFASNFHDLETFLRAKSSTTQLDDLLRNLKNKLKFLRMVRDGTLFSLTLVKTFFWIEILGLLLCFLGIPLVVLYGDSFSLGWLKKLLGTQQWEIQKVMLGIITVMALGMAALHSTIVFERKRDKLLDEAKNQREHLQSMRLDRIRRQREAEAAALAKERKRDAERQRRIRAGE